MTGNFVFVALAVAAAAFMLRFLVAICGRQGRAAQPAILARCMPERHGPSGEKVVSIDSAQGNGGAPSTPAEKAPKSAVRK